MAEIADAIRAVGNHLGAKIDGTNNHLQVVEVEVAAAGAAILAFKSSTEKSFDETHQRQERQTSAMVQLDSVKMHTEALALSRKAASFSEEVGERFNKAVESVVLNRILYDKHFGAIQEEYAEKLRAIGSHIYSIWEEDFAPLEEKERVPTSAYAQISFEVDLQRLASRSAQLDQDLELIRTQHLEPLIALDTKFNATLRETFALDGVTPGDALYVPAVVTLTASGAEVAVDQRAVVTPAGAGSAVAVLEPLGRAPSLHAYCTSLEAQERVARECRTRAMTDGEKAELSAAIGRLAERGIVGPELAPGFIQYLAGVPLSIVDGFLTERTVTGA